ncbi:MAG: trimethylamine methyltransferase family protein [Deltaproteobacteria bacterium]|nr:trimethylamine methyltransferase family protein [Deltaproteobacteria bacterium]
MVESFKQGVLVKPYERLNQDHVKWLDQSSLDILSDPGIWCYNERAAKLFKSHGANVREETVLSKKLLQKHLPGLF